MKVFVEQPQALPGSADNFFLFPLAKGQHIYDTFFKCFIQVPLLAIQSVILVTIFHFCQSLNGVVTFPFQFLLAICNIITIHLFPLSPSLTSLCGVNLN